ncbi:MAG: CARDB domain-containing protein [Limisphaerales bacterium]
MTLDPIPLPDLLVHAFDLPATAFAGQSVTIGWTTTNAGIGGASGGWSTRVSLSQHENGALLLDRGTVSTNRALAVDESVIQAASILVPPGWSGQGYVVLELDVNSAVNESNEGNNRVVSAAPIQILAPDLVLESLGGPNSALLGQTISVTWGVTNRGGASTTVGWRDRVWLTPTAGSRTGATELTAVAGPEGGLSASAGYARTASVTVPLSTSIPPGDYFLLVEADGDGSQPELDKANNRSSRPLRLGLPPSPNLAVSEVTAPASALPGGTIEVHWKVSNLGSVPVVGPWKETLSVSNSVQGLRELALLSFEGAIPAGGVAERTHTLNLPPGTAAGVNAVWVATDAKNEVVESDETDNRRRSEATVSVPQVLTLALSASQIREDASVRTIRGTLTRNGPVSASLRVLLTGADATEITAPAEVTLPAGQSAIVFDLTAVADNVVDGHQAMTLGVNADGYAGATAGLTVLDADLYRLFVTVDPATVAEGGVVTGTVRREDANGPGLTVTLVSSQESQLSPTPSVTIPAGEASATFEALAVNDNRPESPTDYTLVASAPAHHDGTATVRVLDNDVPSLVISLASRSVSEGAGPYATSATVTRKPVGNGDVTVELVNPNPGLLLMPSRVTITGGRDSKSFPVGVVNDGLVNGPRTVAIGGFALAAGSGARLQEAAPDLLTITDDDGPTLKLATAQGLVREGLSPATTITVTRNTDPTAPLEVTLASADTSEATVPSAVTIPAGAVSTTFALTSLADSQPDGNQPVVVTASANGFVDGTVTVVVSDTDLPDLVVNGVAHVTGATSRQRVDVRYRLGNQGLSAATQSVLTRVYLSRDAVVGDDILAAQSRVTETLAVGASVERVETIELPVEIGNYWVVVETDAEQTLDEGLENNNTAISSQPIAVTADYGAWVMNREPDARLAGSPMPLYGQTTNTAGAPVGNKPVVVHVFVRGTERKISATSDSSGNFTAIFNPLPGEAGHYDIFATHPGIARVPVQDTFALLGFRPEPASQSLTLIEGSSRALTVKLRNLADIDLEGLTAEIVSKPANLEVTFGVSGAGDAVQESPRRSFRLATVTPALSRAGGKGEPLVSGNESVGGKSRWRLASVADESEANYVGVGQAVGLHRAEPRLHGDGATLPALGTLDLNVNLRAPVAESYGTVHLKVRTDEGLAQDVYFGVSVEPLRPRLVAIPGNLSASMLVGGQSIVEFDVVNVGGKVSGPVTLSLPNVPWMSLATTNPMPALAPGETNRVTVLLTPASDLPLGPYTGNLAANTPGAGVGIPFNFRAVSEAKGDLRIEVVDEFTYYAEGAPKVVGAQIVVRDAATREEIALGTTGEEGFFHFSGLAAAYYEIEVTADKHGPSKIIYSLKGGINNDVQVLLRRQTVTYTWTVEPVVLDDHYQVSVDTTFESYVPVPVVTVTPRYLDLSAQEISGAGFQINITISNHGAIAASEVQLQLPSHPLYVFSTPIEYIGVLPANSSLVVPINISRLSSINGEESPYQPDELSSTFAMYDSSEATEETICHCTRNDWVKKDGSEKYKIPIDIPLTCGDEISGHFSSEIRYIPELGIGKDKDGNPIVGSPTIHTMEPDSWTFQTKCIVDYINVIVCDDQPPLWGGVRNIIGCKNPITEPPCGGWDSKVGGSDCDPFFRDSPKDFFDLPSGTTRQLFNKVVFKTFPVLRGGCIPERHFVPLDGLIWGYRLSYLEDGDEIVEYDFIPAGVTSPNLDEIKKALVSGGFFDDWKVLPKSAARLCIEPTSQADHFLASENGVLLGDVLINDRKESCAPISGASLISTTSNGILTFGDDGNFIYRPRCGWSGFDEFVYRAQNGSVSGCDTRVVIEIQPCSLVPVVLSSVTCGKVELISHSPIMLQFTPRCLECVGGASVGVPVGNLIGSYAGVKSGVTAPNRIVSNSDQCMPSPSTHANHANSSGVPAGTGMLADPESGVCAQVKLQLEQDAVLARDGFGVTLEVGNQGSERLSNMRCTIEIRTVLDENASQVFSERLVSLEGIGSIDGNGILPGNSTGTAKWLIIPTVDAAPNEPTQYFVGGTLSYRLDGQDVTVPLADVPITVLPSPRLCLKYFHERDVFSDDPFTPALEPSIPYNLAVMIENRGKGLAKNFRITSAQPRIVENEKGLLANFQIIAAQVAGRSVSPSLTVNFGDIGPDSRTLGRWLMTSSIQGLFTDYKATFEHIDGLGNPRLSLIDEVSIFEMNHLVQADGAFEDGLPDFLVNAVPDSRDLPDTLFLSDGTTNEVALVETATLDVDPSVNDLEVRLTTSMPSGWAYLRVPEPSEGQLRLMRVMRASGTEVPFGTNVWVTDRTFIGLGRRPLNEHTLHLLDHDSAGDYTLVYSIQPAELTDDVPPTSFVQALPESVMPWFQVSWTGTDEGRLGEAASGVAGYDVYVSENGGAFTPWLKDTQLVSATYIGTAGASYAFYSVATDGAGNVEETPQVPDTRTHVGRLNAAPVLVVSAQVEVQEGSTAEFVASATDADGVEQTLTFSLGPVHPPGAVIDATTGRVTWPTGEADGGTTRRIDIVVTDNGFPSQNASGAVSVVVREVNSPPIAVGDSIRRQSGKRVRVRESQFLVNDLDVDGDTLSLSGVASTSVQGGVVRRAEGWVTYIPPVGNDGPDQFTYTVTDGAYEVTGVVEVAVGGTDDDATLNIIGTVVGPDGTIRLTLVGIPGWEYAIQMATSLVNPIWSPVGAARADATGRFEFIHANPPLGAAFYRAVERVTPALRQE